MSGHLRTFVTRATGRDGAEDVTVDDAAWATLRHRRRSGGQRRGDAGWRPAARTRCRSSSTAAAARSRFDLERLNELRVDASTAPRACTVGCWSPSPTTPTSTPGGRRGTSSAGTTRSPRRPPTSCAAIGRGPAPDAVVRRRARGAAGAGRDRGECGRLGRSVASHPDQEDTMRHEQALHPLHRPVGRPDARGGGRARRRLGVRRARDRRLRRAPRRLALGRRRLRRRAARGSCERHGLEAVGDLQPPQGPGRLRRPDRLPAPGDRRLAGVGRRRPRGRPAAGRRGDEATPRGWRSGSASTRSSGSPAPRSGSTSRCSRRCRPPGSTPATRTSPTAGTRSSTSSTSAACGSPTRCTPPRSPTTTGRPARTLEAIGHRAAFGLNWDPSHMMWQGIDPVAFITDFADRIYHVDCKDTRMRMGGGRNGILVLAPAVGRPAPRLGLRLAPAAATCRGRTASGRCAAIGYDGPISVEWEDAGMDRLHGAPEALDVPAPLRLRPALRRLRRGLRPGVGRVSVSPPRRGNRGLLGANSPQEDRRLAEQVRRRSGAGGSRGCGGSGEPYAPGAPGRPTRSECRPSP